MRPQLLLSEHGNHSWHPGDDRAWARRDPDLAFVRDAPRFEELVGEE
jgi:hypothetical protein